MRQIFSLCSQTASRGRRSSRLSSEPNRTGRVCNDGEFIALEDFSLITSLRHGALWDFASFSVTHFIYPLMTFEICYGSVQQRFAHHESWAKISSGWNVRRRTSWVDFESQDSEVLLFLSVITIIGIEKKKKVGQASRNDPPGNGNWDLRRNCQYLIPEKVTQPLLNSM